MRDKIKIYQNYVFKSINITYLLLHKIMLNHKFMHFKNWSINQVCLNGDNFV